MSDRNQGQAIHPEIASIIRKRDEIHRLLYVDYSPIPATAQMIGLLYGLRQEHREEEFAKILNQTYLGLTTIHSRTQRLQHGKDMKWKLWGHYKKLYGLLWEHGYLSPEFYKGIIPAETLKKERKAPEEAPFPERLPENLG